MLSYLIMVVKVWVVFWIANEVFCKLIAPEHAKWARTRALPMMMTFYAVGMLGHFVWLLYLTLMLYIPIVSRTRAEGAALFVVALGSVSDLQTGISIGGASIIAVDKYVCLAISLLIVFVKEPRDGLPSSFRFDLPYLLVIVLDLIQARGLNFTSTTRSILLTILSLVIPYFAFSRSLTKAEDLRRVMVAFTYLGVMLGAIGIFESVTHFFIFQQMYQTLGVPGFGGKMYKIRGGLLRSVTSFNDATAFSLFLAIAAGAAMSCRYSFRSTSKLAIALLIIAGGIFCTSSRNAWIALVLMVFGFDFFRRRYLALTGKVAVLAGLFVLLMLAAEVSPYFAEMTGKGEDTASTSTYRSMLLKRGQEEFWKHPLIGTDVGTVTANMVDMVQGEGIIDFVNSYLFFALTCGIGGLIGLLAAFFTLPVAMLSIRKSVSRHPFTLDRYAAFAFATGITYGITVAFTAFGGRSSIFFGIVVAIGGAMFSWRKLPTERIAASDPTAPGLKRGLPQVQGHELGPIIPTSSRRTRGGAARLSNISPLLQNEPQDS